MKLSAGKNIRVRQIGDEAHWRIDAPAPVPALSAGRNIRLERTAAGIRINALAPPGGGGASGGRDEILVYLTNRNLPAGQAVVVSGLGAEQERPAAQWNDATPRFGTARIAGDGEAAELFALTLEPSVNNWTRAAISGPAKVTLDVSNSQHGFAVTGTTVDGEHVFRSAAHAGARILFRGTSRGPAVIMLGWHGMAEQPYYAQFVAVPDSENQTVAVLNGLDPDSDYAGAFWWGVAANAIQVPKAVFPLQMGTIYLRAALGGDNVVTAQLVAGQSCPDTRTEAYVAIAMISKYGIVTQVHKDGNINMTWRA